MKDLRITTGKWNLIENGETSEYYTSFDKEPHLIVKHNEKSIKETKANAKAIESIPEMIELVEELRSLLGDGLGNAFLNTKRDVLKYHMPELDKLQIRAINVLSELKDI